MAKAASLILAVAIWFLIKDLLDNQSQTGLVEDEPTILGPAINPALQDEPTQEGVDKEKTTVH